MTDRLHSCKDSPDGRHRFVFHPPAGWVQPVHARPSLERATCRYCGREALMCVQVLTGHTMPAKPDAHLGATGGE
jgi:hypothetical protein